MRPTGPVREDTETMPHSCVNYKNACQGVVYSPLLGALPPAVAISIPTYVLVALLLFGVAAVIIVLTRRSPALAHAVEAAGPWLVAGLTVLLIGWGLLQ